MFEIHQDSPQADALPQPPVQSGKTRLEAVQKMTDMLPEMERLAQLTGRRRIRVSIEYVRRALERSFLEVKRDEERMERDQRLMEWAKRHGIRGEDYFLIQGTMIRMAVRWTYECGAVLKRTPEGGASPLSFEDGKTAGFRTLKALANRFDPAEHGESFRKFAEPFITAVLQHCLIVGRNTIPDTPTFELIEGIRANAGSLAPQPDPSPPQEDPPADPPPALATPQPIAPVRHDPSPPPPPPVADPPPPSSEPDPPPPEEPEDTEDQQEVKRRRRFCRWAKDEHKIPVTQEQFEIAVLEVAKKFHPLAKSVVDGLHIPSSFHGGKGAVRRRAIGLLPQRIREFDFAGGVHFNQFLKEWLEMKLKEFIGKK